MAEVVVCPECRRRLTLGNSQPGQVVQCPTCRVTFTVPIKAGPLVVSNEGAGVSVTPARLTLETELVKPHRGSLILTLSILGVVLSCFPPAGWTLGGVAYAMAENDLHEMKYHRMDEEGRGSTHAAKICGVVALVLSTLAPFAAVLLGLLGAAAAG